MSMVITPALLEPTTKELVSQLARIASQLPDVLNVHIDIMDGKLVTHKNNIDPDLIMNVESPLRFELHLMVEDPLTYMRAWQKVENVFRVLYQAESKGDLMRPASFARKEGWDVGLVLNPETPLTQAEKIFTHVDLVQFMTVHPGTQGAAFEPETLTKIGIFTHNRPVSDYSHQPVLCAVDGHVTPENIGIFKTLGVDVCNVGSALVKARNMFMAYCKLQEALKA